MKAKNFLHCYVLIYNCALDLLEITQDYKIAREREVQRFLTLRIHCWGLKQRHSFKNVFSASLEKMEKLSVVAPYSHTESFGAEERHPPNGCALCCVFALLPTTSPNTSQRFIYGFASIYFSFCLVPISIYVWGHNLQIYTLPTYLFVLSICDYSNINLHLHVCVFLLSHAWLLCDPIDCM